MRRDAEHRHARAVAIEEPVDQVQIAGSAATRAYRQLARQVRLGTGGERSGLLVAHMHPVDLSLPADRVRKPVEAVADDAVDALHTRSGKYLDKLVGDG